MAKKVAIVLTSGFADWEYALIAGVGGPFGLAQHLVVHVER